MSNALAVAAVTRTLLQRLQEGVGSAKVTAMPPDKARGSEGGGSGSSSDAQLNLFLYHTSLNAAWRNLDVPRQSGGAGEVGRPPLALNLYYLLTAYGRANSNNGDGKLEEVDAHRVLGRAMRVLHDNPLLGRPGFATIDDPDAGPDDTEAGNGGFDSGLGRQFERIRVVPHPLSLDDLSKLWSGFKTEYRLSVAYEASVVLIDSRRQDPTAPPVLTRGKDDRGVFARAAGEPALEDIVFTSGLPVARVAAAGEAGEAIVFTGENLPVDPATATIRLARSGAAPDETPEFELPPDPRAKGAPPGLTVIPRGPQPWRAGHYTAAVRLAVADLPYPQWSNAITFPVAPRLLPAASTGLSTRVDGKILEVAIPATACLPLVAPSQNVSLILTFNPPEPTETTSGVSPRYFIAPAARREHETDAIVFKFASFPSESRRYLARLRVDGVDSVPVRRFTVVLPDGRKREAWELDPEQMFTLQGPPE